jgi:hypothetical protein
MISIFSYDCMRQYGCFKRREKYFLFWLLLCLIPLSSLDAFTVAEEVLDGFDPEGDDDDQHNMAHIGLPVDNFPAFMPSNAVDSSYQILQPLFDPNGLSFWIFNSFFVLGGVDMNKWYVIRFID